MSGSSVVRFLLRLPQELYEALQIVAEREHRSINSQIIHVLERFIAESREEEIGEGKVAA